MRIVAVLALAGCRLGGEWHGVLACVDGDLETTQSVHVDLEHVDRRTYEGDGQVTAAGWWTGDGIEHLVELHYGLDAVVVETDGRWSDEPLGVELTYDRCELFIDGVLASDACPEAGRSQSDWYRTGGQEITVEGPCEGTLSR